jgi:hypothetical protein
MKPIKLNGDLKNLDVKNGLFNKSLINVTLIKLNRFIYTNSK